MTSHIAVTDTDPSVYACYQVTPSGKGRAYIGCEHPTPRLAIAHSDLIDGPTPRPDQPDLAVPGGTPSRDAAGQPEAPELLPEASVLVPAGGVASPTAGDRTCAWCGSPLPADSRRHRRTDTPACRRALARAEAKGDGVDALGVGTDVPLSRASQTAPTDTLGL